ACKEHIGFYPMESAVKAFAKDLGKYKTTAGSIQFPLNRPLPLALVKKSSGSGLRKVRMAPLNGDLEADALILLTLRSLPDLRASHARGTCRRKPQFYLD
ncbi:MAG TPA: hypothetical protein VFH08_00050, partial [Chitinophagaceae bacterium]|nr:hypothetical protein [Chitinophagaceae bacterium]